VEVGSSSKCNFLSNWDELFDFSDTHARQRNRFEIGIHKYIRGRLALEP